MCYLRAPNTLAKTIKKLNASPLLLCTEATERKETGNGLGTQKIHTFINKLQIWKNFQIKA